MKLKGDLFISREINSKRSNEGLNTEALAADRAVLRYDNAWLRLDGSTTDYVVELPDATTLPVGWKVIVHNMGSTNSLTVKDYDGTFTGVTQKIITAPVSVNDTAAYQFVLLTNGTAAGLWYVIELGDASRLRAARFVANFLTADWPAAVGGYRTLTSTQTAGLAAVTHDRGTTPNFEVYEKTGTDHDKLMLDRERTDASGNVTLRIIDGDQFDGRIVLI